MAKELKHFLMEEHMRENGKMNYQTGKDSQNGQMENDIIQPEFQPILYPDSEVKSKFPNYRKLTIDRLYNLN